MRKNESYEMTAASTRIEKAMIRDWMCLGSRTGYWPHSPWRALAEALRR